MEVANFFLQKTNHETETVISPLKLQKVCYYAQAWCLALNGVRLFDDEFVAWPHGPVNEDLYHKYKDYKWRPIDFPEDFDDSVLSLQERNYLNDVWELYGKYDAKYLEDLTHQELPWQEAREGYPEGHHCSVVIREETMRNYYRELLADG